MRKKYAGNLIFIPNNLGLKFHTAMYHRQQDTNRFFRHMLCYITYQFPMFTFSSLGDNNE